MTAEKREQGSLQNGLERQQNTEAGNDLYYLRPPHGLRGEVDIFRIDIESQQKTDGAEQDHVRVLQTRRVVVRINVRRKIVQLDEDHEAAAITMKMPNIM